MRLGFLALLLLVALAFVSTDFGRAFGSAPEGKRLERMLVTKRYLNGEFVNSIPTPMMTGSTSAVLWRWLFEPTEREPKHALSFPALEAELFQQSPTSRLRLTWLGHSTVLIEIDGQRVLTDPVFAERASPSTWFGPKRFFPPPLALEKCPSLDAVVISHDHYDHLDHRSIQTLDRVTQKFFVPLGVAAHLEGWGIDPQKIVELDWWQSTTFAGLEFTATPARHFSGRSLGDRNRTSWASWVIVGNRHRVFFTGDTGYFGAFADIGKRYGPFDASLVEAGAYDRMWADIHLGPDNVVKVHEDLRARVLLPVHWGTFNLAVHAWTEPVQKLRSMAERQGFKLAQPYPGQSFEVEGELPRSRWWAPPADAK